VAEIVLSSIVRQKNVLDTVGHYSRPDILRLKVDRSEHKVVEDIDSRFEEMVDKPNVDKKNRTSNIERSTSNIE